MAAAPVKFTVPVPQLKLPVFVQFAPAFIVELVTVKVPALAIAPVIVILLLLVISAPAAIVNFPLTVRSLVQSAVPLIVRFT